MLMTAFALLISSGLSARDATQTQTRAEKQNRSAATIQTQTRNEYQNYGQMTSEQKQARNAERKALKNQQKELKRQQKELKKQQASMNQERNRDLRRTEAGNRTASNATSMKNAVKVSRGSGPGRK